MIPIPNKLALKLIIGIACALLPSACATTRTPQPIPAVAEQRMCPTYPLPPQDLLKPPAKTDFLSKTSAPAGT